MDALTARWPALCIFRWVLAVKHAAAAACKRLAAREISFSAAWVCEWGDAENAGLENTGTACLWIAKHNENEFADG